MFPTGLTEVMVTPPPLEPPRPGLDLAPDLVLGLALCDVFRLLDLPTLVPFSIQAAFDTLVSYRRDPHSGSPGMRLRAGQSRSFLSFRICCFGHARTTSPSRHQEDPSPSPSAGHAPSLPAWRPPLPGWSAPTGQPLLWLRPSSAAPGLPPSWPRRRSGRPRLLWPCLRLCRPRLLLSCGCPL